MLAIFFFIEYLGKDLLKSISYEYSGMFNNVH